MKPSALLLSCLLAPLPLPAQAKGRAKASPKPAAFRKAPFVFGREVLRVQWPGTLQAVNAPAARDHALPGQELSFGLMADGEGRDALIEGARFTFEISFAGRTEQWKEQRSLPPKHIKADGADMVLEVMRAGGVDAGRLKGSEVGPDLSMVSLATFDLGWRVPADAQDGVATLRGTARLADGREVRVSAELPVWSLATAEARGGLKDMAAVGNWYMGYFGSPNPMSLLSACRVLAADEHGFDLNILGFLAQVLRQDPGAAARLAERAAAEPRPVRFYMAYLLREAGMDLQGLLGRMDAQEREALVGMTRLPDPYDLKVDPARFDTPQHMDMLWGLFLASGDPRPVRALAGLLAWRDDLAAFQGLAADKSEPKEPSEAALRGVVYRTAGWSLGSFARSHGIVADWVAAWKEDPTLPAVVREELKGLAANPAFRGD